MRVMHRLLAAVALTAVPLSSGLGASASSGAPATAAPVAHTPHKGGAKVGVGAETAAKGPASPSLPHFRPATAGGKTAAKPVMRGPLNAAPSNATIVKGLNATPHGVAPGATGAGQLTVAPHATAASSGAVRLSPTSRPVASAMTPAMGGGLGKTTAQINGSTIAAHGTATARINPSPKASGSINGTDVGRRN